MTSDAPASLLTSLRLRRGAKSGDAKVGGGRKRRWQRWLIAAVVLAAIAAFVLAPRAVEVAATSVVSTTPSQQDALLTASGYVVAQRRAAVASKATGRLLELKVREGSEVKRGELIARLDASDVAAAIAAAQAGLAQARVGVAQAEAAIHQARAGVRQAEVELNNAAVELTRNQGLKDGGFVSPQAEDAAQRRVDAARAALAGAQAGVVLASAGRSQAEAGVVLAQAQLKVQQVNLDNTEIRAPFDGVVLVKNANVGDMITPFSSAAGTLGAVVTMADMATLEVEADVSESKVALVHKDQPVEITLDAFPDLRLRGSVARIVPTVDRAKATVMTKVRFEQIDPRVLPEMSAKVSLLARRPDDADLQAVLAVNPRAVLERAGQTVVLRIGKDETVEQITVQRLRSLGDLVELQEPGGAASGVAAASGASAAATGALARLRSGDRLVLSPDAKLVPGMKVKIAAAGGLK
jgi:multidrug resistance efflux pump